MAKKPLIKVHLGCGSKILPGWVNVDVRASTGADIVEDVKELSQINDNSCDLLYASHLLEHFGRNEYLNVLKVWFNKLKPGGVLRIAVPDFSAVVRRYRDTGDIGEVTGLICGGQRDVHDYHRMVFDEKLLTAALEQIGFVNVHKWDWRKTEHSQTDDFSQAFLPHMDKVNGQSMSLNLEATRPRSQE